ncbi:MAG: hypothetical protein M3130_05550 [Actinomycetota bacterium]|nr:hypothetical protein [Actinomycetota bacterium]
MQILLWLVPSAVVACLAMAWVSWAGRARAEGPDRSDAAAERFAAAIMRDHPGEGRFPGRARQPDRDRSTGIAVRPSRGGGESTRRTA